MTIEELGSRALPLDVRGISPARCDLTTHRNVGKAIRREEARRIQSPGVVIDAEKVAAIIEKLAESSEHSQIVPEEPVIDLPEATPSPAKRRWESAVSHAVAIVGRLTKTEGPDVAGHSGTILFDGLRDPQRREKAMQTVEVLYESVPATRR